MEKGVTFCTSADRKPPEDSSGYTHKRVHTCMRTLEYTHTYTGQQGGAGARTVLAQMGKHWPCETAFGTALGAKRVLEGSDLYSGSYMAGRRPVFLSL